MQALTQTADGTIYEVFAQFRLDEPLHHVGSVVAPDDELAKLYASTLYDELDWRQMFVTPRCEIVHMIEPD